MSQSPINWVEGIPSGTSAVGTFPGFAQSTWTAMAQGMSTELFWPGVGGGSSLSAGVLQPGGSRVFVGTQSQSSNSAVGDILGRGMYWSDRSELVVYDSAGTHLGGSPFAVHYGTSPSIVTQLSSLSRAVYTQFTGTVVLGSGVTTTTINVSFPTQFVGSGLPLGFYPIYITASSNSSGQGNYQVTVTSQTSSGFTATASLLSVSGTTSLSGATIMWQALFRTATA